MRTRRTRRLAAFSAVAILVVGACGDDDDEGSETTEAPEAIEATAETQAPAETDAPVETEPSESSAPEPPTQDTDGDVDMWCGVLDETDEVEMVFNGLTTLTPTEVEAGLGRVSEILPLVIDAAPPEIRADAAVVVGQAEVLIDALADAEYNFLDVDLSTFDDPEYEAQVDTSNRALDDYSLANCGRPFGDPSPDPAEDPAQPDDGAFDPGGGTIREQAVQSLVDLGFLQDEAACIVENVDINDPTAFTDQEKLQSLLDACGISEERFIEATGF